MTTEQAIQILEGIRDKAELFNDAADCAALNMALDALKTRNNRADAVIGKPVYKIRVRRARPGWAHWGRRSNRKEWRWLAENGHQVKRDARSEDCTFEIEERVGTKTDAARLGDVVFLNRDDAEKRLKILLGGKE